MTLRTRLSLATAIAAATLPLAVAAAPATPRAPGVLGGEWGGDQFSLRALGTGAMIQGKCAVGRIDTPIQLDAKGQFTASGYFNPVTSGYLLSDVSPRDRSVYLAGRVQGATMEVTLTIAGVPGTTRYKLRQGKVVRFADCRAPTPTGAR